MANDPLVGWFRGLVLLVEGVGALLCELLARLAALVGTWLDEE